MSADDICGTCRFWSDLLAQAPAGRGIEAMCLAENSPHHGKYTPEKHSCCAWKIGDLGAIDTPGFDGTEYDEPPSEDLGKIIDTQIEGALANG